MNMRLSILMLLVCASCDTLYAAAAKQYGPQGQKTDLTQEEGNYLNSEVLFADSYTMPNALVFDPYNPSSSTVYTARKMTLAHARKHLAESWSFDKKNQFKAGEITLFPYSNKFSDTSDELSYHLGIIVSNPDASSKEGAWLVKTDSEGTIYKFKTEELGKYKKY